MNVKIVTWLQETIMLHPPYFHSSRQIPHSSSASPRHAQKNQQPPQIVALPNTLIVLRHERHLSFCLPKPTDVHVGSHFYGYVG